VTRTDSDSFYAWANAPAADDSQGADGPLPLTNLALYAYRSRSDVQAIYPDVFGQHRLHFAEWFVLYAPEAFGLDAAFIAPVRERFIAWANAPAAEDTDRQPGQPLITSYALWIYRCRPDLQATFPDIFGHDRRQYAWWFVHKANASTRDPALIAPMQASLRGATNSWLIEGGINLGLAITRRGRRQLRAARSIMTNAQLPTTIARRVLWQLRGARRE
jgi:hypothetical protein